MVRPSKLRIPPNCHVKARSEAWHCSSYVTKGLFGSHPAAPWTYLDAMLHFLWHEYVHVQEVMMYVWMHVCTYLPRIYGLWLFGRSKRCRHVDSWLVRITTGEEEQLCRRKGGSNNKRTGSEWQWSSSSSHQPLALVRNWRIGHTCGARNCLKATRTPYLNSFLPNLEVPLPPSR